VVKLYKGGMWARMLSAVCLWKRSASCGEAVQRRDVGTNAERCVLVEQECARHRACASCGEAVQRKDVGTKRWAERPSRARAV